MSSSGDISLTLIEIYNIYNKKEKSVDEETTLLELCSEKSQNF